MSETTTHETTGPRTYQSAWQWNKDGTSKLMTAEEWLAEEAEVDASLDAVDDSPDDGPSRPGVMRAIAKEIAELRAERTQWAEAYTRLVGHVQRQGLPLPVDLPADDAPAHA